MTEQTKDPVSFSASYQMAETDQAIISECGGLSTRLSAVAVKSQEDYEASTTQLKEIKAAAKKLEERKKAILAPFTEAVAAIRDLFRGPEDTLASAEKHLKASATTYYLQMEAERKKQEEAQREALRRIEEENRRKEEEARRKREQEQREAEEKAKQAPVEEDAFAIPSFDEPELQSPMVEPEPITGEVVEAAPMPEPITAFVPKASGVSVTKKWKHEVLDPMKIPREYTIPNDKALADYASSMKEHAKMEGVRFYEDAIMSAGRGRS